MRAKVVPTKYCDNAFDCTTCTFDKAMARRMSQESPDAGWDTKMFQLAGEEQHCRHALTGRVPKAKMCARNYECGDCPFDQMLDDMIQVDHTLFGPPQYLNAHGYLVPRDYYLHKGHGWARVEYGGRIRVGLDDFGNSLVGKVDLLDFHRWGPVSRPGRNALPCNVRDTKQVCEFLFPGW